ncbi:excitatory amino acid transporter-like [Mya arenaria]|uniref:excitatory amino acid transporter-like n=1 Tax=Mya arenaria TaxID=6604 RepID=UPI0022E740B1|nr:excitatory amino acid transporter-like [Mya arenaria]
MDNKERISNVFTVDGCASHKLDNDSNMDVERKMDSRSFRAKCLGLVRQNLLVTLTLVGVGCGFLIGLLVEPTGPSASTLMWIGMPGELYIRMLKMMIVPLVICSVISGTARMDPRSNGKVSGIALGYIMVQNLLGTVIGTAICLIVKPGEGVEVDEDLKFEGDVMKTEDIFADLLRNIVPDNLVAACFRQAQTKYEFESHVIQRDLALNVTETVREVTRKYVGAADSTNILGLIIVCSAFGVAAAALEEQGAPFLAFFRSATETIVKILRVLIWTTPVGVASLIAKTIAGTSNMETVFQKLGIYFACVLSGLILWSFLLIPLMFFLVRRQNPYRFLGSIVPPIMMVFATGSTMIALPESFICLEEKNGVDSRISRFVAPLAATIGRSGSALYIASSCVFIIQTLGRDVSGVDIILVILLTWISALAIPSVTGASLITVLVLLTALNIPGEAAAMLFALEFFLDRSRSVGNLIDQLTCVMVNDRFCAASLDPHPVVTEETRSLMDKAGAASEIHAHGNMKL